MASYFSNFGSKLQMMVEIAKEYGFTSNFDMPRLFTPRKMELPHKMVNSIVCYLIFGTSNVIILMIIKKSDLLQIGW